VHPGRRERFQLLRGRHHEQRRLVRPHDARRMRIEGHDDGGGPVFAGNAADPIEDFAVAAVYPVEVAERQDRLHPVRRPGVVRKMDDVHRSSDVSFRARVDHHGHNGDR
jgi:hypothetical protein